MSGRDQQDSERYPPHRSEGSLSLRERLERYERWMDAHEIVDNTRHEAVMNRFTKLDGDAAEARGKIAGHIQIGNIIAAVLGLLGTVGGIYAAFFK